MNYSEVLKTLNQASAFDLYRLRAAIVVALNEPHWMQAVQSRLKVGQVVQFFDLRANALRRGQVLELRRKDVVLLELEGGGNWVMSYAAINVDGVDVNIREQKPQGLGRNEVAIGDTVGFLDREQQQRTGKIIRLNDKTVTLLCDSRQWRVSYSFLHHVVDAHGNVHDVVELGAAPAQQR